MEERAKLIRTENCIICFEDLSIKKCKVLECAHKFHEDCIEEWAIATIKDERDFTCPICRATDEQYKQEVVDVLTTIHFNGERNCIMYVAFFNIILNFMNICIQNEYYLYYNYLCLFINFSGYYGAYNLNTFYLYIYLLAWFLKLIFSINYNAIELKNVVYIANNEYILILSELFSFYIFLTIGILIKKINEYKLKVTNLTNIDTIY